MPEFASMGMVHLQVLSACDLAASRAQFKEVSIQDICAVASWSLPLTLIWLLSVGGRL